MFTSRQKAQSQALAEEVETVCKELSGHDRKQLAERTQKGVLL